MIEIHVHSVKGKISYFCILVKVSGIFFTILQSELRPGMALGKIIGQDHYLMGQI